jgi:serine/threonine-protein kinase
MPVDADAKSPRTGASSHPTSPGLGFAPGSVIADRYRVASMLGRGGMGEVYAADDLKIGQRVALKFLPAHRLQDSTWRKQFYAEVRMARQVSHPNVCRMYDVGESDGRLFLSMEFVDGEDLVPWPACPQLTQGASSPELRAISYLAFRDHHSSKA